MARFDQSLAGARSTYVEGDIDQLYGSNGYAIDSSTGAITFDKNQGLVVGYALTVSDQLRGTMAFGMNQGKTAQAVDNKQLQQLFVNLIYSPIKNVELGGEMMLGERKTFGGEIGAMRRVDLMVALFVLNAAALACTVRHPDKRGAGGLPHLAAGGSTGVVARALSVPMGRAVVELGAEVMPMAKLTPEEVHGWLSLKTARWGSVFEALGAYAD